MASPGPRSLRRQMGSLALVDLPYRGLLHRPQSVKQASKTNRRSLGSRAQLLRLGLQLVPVRHVPHPRTLNTAIRPRDSRTENLVDNVADGLTSKSSPQSPKEKPQWGPGLSPAASTGEGGMTQRTPRQHAKLPMVPPQLAIAVPGVLSCPRAEAAGASGIPSASYAHRRIAAPSRQPRRAQSRIASARSSQMGSLRGANPRSRATSSKTVAIRRIMSGDSGAAVNVKTCCSDIGHFPPWGQTSEQGRRFAGDMLAF